MNTTVLKSFLYVVHSFIEFIDLFYRYTLKRVWSST